MRFISSHNPQRLRRHLARGGVIAYPTESCYGLGCVPTSHRAIKKIIKIKKRPQHKGLIVIGKNVSQLEPLLQRLKPLQNSNKSSKFSLIKEFRGFFHEQLFLPIRPNPAEPIHRPIPFA